MKKRNSGTVSLEVRWETSLDSLTFLLQDHHPTLGTLNILDALNVCWAITFSFMMNIAIFDRGGRSKMCNEYVVICCNANLKTIRETNFLFPFFKFRST